MWKAGTLCITIAANIADTAILGIDACFPDSVIGFIPDQDKADARFIKYLFDALLQRQYKTFTQGAAQDNLSQAKLLSLTFPIPGLSEQQYIADILSAYDDLIENNRRRIQLLKQAARLLYKEWFVHLRFPGHEHVKINNGVPEGWERKPLGDVLMLQRGFDLPVNNRKDGPYPIYASTGINGYHAEAKVKGPGVVTGRSGSIGTVMYVPDDFWPLNTSLWIKEFKKVGPLFAVHLLSGLHLEQYNGGAAVPTLNRNDVHRIEVLCPSKTVLELFDEHVAPVYRQIKILEEQSKKLQSARDLLLPRLMNGEIAL
jgi:type I restriction enzyme S subunit